jgi:hypothetical protein
MLSGAVSRMSRVLWFGHRVPNRRQLVKARCRKAACRVKEAAVVRTASSQATGQRQLPDGNQQSADEMTVITSSPRKRCGEGNLKRWGGGGGGSRYE